MRSKIKPQLNKFGKTLLFLEVMLVVYNAFFPVFIEFLKIAREVLFWYRMEDLRHIVLN